MNAKLMAATLMVLSAAACAAPLRVETSASGAAIPNKGNFVWLVPEVEQPHLPEASRIRITEALAAKGLVPARRGEKADYLLLVNYARRPVKIGLAAMDPAPAPGGEPAWLARPGKSGKQLSSLQLRFLDPATGNEISQSSAQASHGRRDAPIVLDRLIDGVLLQTP